MKTITTIECATPVTTAATGPKLPVPGPKHTGAAPRFADKPAVHPALKAGAAPGSLNAAAIAAEGAAIIGEVPASLKRTRGEAPPAPVAKGKSIIEQLAAKVEAKDATKAAAIKAVAAAKEEKAAAKTGRKSRRADAKAAAPKAPVVDASGGKAALRAAAAKAVAETKVPVTKVPAGVKGKAAAKTAKAPAEKKAPAAKKAAPAAKAKAEKTGGYDWDAATVKAKAGTIPPTPPFVSYGPHMQKAHDMAKAGQAAELRAYLGGFTADPCPPSRKNLFRYGELCLTAVKAGAKK